MWTQFDLDQLDPNQIYPDQGSSVNAALVHMHNGFITYHKQATLQAHNAEASDQRHDVV